MDDVARDRFSSRVPYHKGFGDVGTRAMEIFEKSVEIIKIWCKIKKRQISDVTAA
ncbi:MAG: hypothetical protein P2A85_11315 [Microcoleus anatoxicus]|uniref:hypothetical protein n=1 Tax=Microcoleus anatoxicus TaxID=2705319 RepID=UPI00366A809A